MGSVKEIGTESSVRYKLVPPDGGWGYLVTLSVIVMNLVTIVPLGAFGLLYGNFLAFIGDETTGTTLTNGIFNTVQSFTGLATNYLLQKYSYRKVGLLGAILYFTGALATVFITSLPQMIISFGILQGLGFGLMTPATFSAFSSYFGKKINLMMGIAQAMMVLASMFFPLVMAFLVEYVGFRGGVVFLAVLALLNFPAMGVLQPVKWHMKKIPVETFSINNEILVFDDKLKSSTEELSRTQTVPLLNKKMEEAILPPDANGNSFDPKFKDIVMEPTQRTVSVINLGDRAMSITTINNVGYEQEKQPTKCMDLSLLKDLKYLNISCGIALSFTADVAFNSVLPLVLSNIGFQKSTTAFMMMVFFGSDLVSRILISVVSAICTIRNRYVFLAGAFFTAVFRIAFIMDDSYMWRTLTLGVLGFLRCWIQTPLALVIVEEYKDNFPTAFSLYMVVCGFISLIFGPLMSYVKSVTQSDDMVIHVLTVALLWCSLSWMIELLWKRAAGRCASKKDLGS